jgi:peptidoglycan-associated lipoprotein
MVITSYEGYFPNDMKVAVYDNKDTLISVTHILEKIELNKTVRMDNIYYDYNKATVRFESLPALDVLVDFMMKNPKVKIELSSHTDERGYDDYNLKLSEGRAKNAAMYLILEDIDNSRIIYKGYGETKPLIRGAKTEEEHQLNRRTEFKVISID